MVRSSNPTRVAKTPLTNITVLQRELQFFFVFFLYALTKITYTFESAKLAVFSLLETFLRLKQRVFTKRKATMLLSCIYLGRIHRACYRVIACDLKACNNAHGEHRALASHSAENNKAIMSPYRIPSIKVSQLHH